MVRKGRKTMIKLSYPINDCIVDDNNTYPIYFDKLIYVKKLEGKRRYEVKYKTHLNSLSWEHTIEINPSKTIKNIVIDHTVYFSKKDFKILCEKYPETENA